MKTSDSEFPDGQAEPPRGLDRRAMLQWLAASAALAGLGTACREPEEKILPYVRKPLGAPGIPVYYATSFVLDGFATGLIGRTHEGRPTKLEGNPEHPASLGATGVFEQASVLDLYDPERCAAPLRSGAPIAWQTVLAELAAAPDGRRPPPWFVLYPQSSPLLGSLVGRVRERHRGARVSFVSPLARRAGYAATRAVFGRPLEPQWRFERARVVLALDSDFTSSGAMSVRWARDWAAARRPGRPDADMSRSYVVEAMPSPTGTVADHRLALRSAEVPELAAAVLAQVLARGAVVPGMSNELRAALPRPERSPHAAFVRAVADDLVRAQGASIVVAGDGQSIETHVVAIALNLALGNLGQTLTLTEPALLEPEGGEPLSALVEAIRVQAVDTVVVLEADPVKTAPPELELGRWLARVPNSFHLTHRVNATSRRCRTVLPLAHFLESWGDARAYDGTVSFIQPLIAPLKPSRSAIELLAACAGAEARGHALLRDFWREQLGAGFEERWEALLRDGFARDSRFPDSPTTPAFDGAAELVRKAAAPALRQGLEVRLDRSHSVYDGRFATNPWLLELPDPITKQCWGNAAVMGPLTANSLSVDTGDLVELERAGRKLRVPVLVCDGHAEHSITIGVGYGDDVGADAFALGSPGASLGGVRATATGQREVLAITQRFRDPGRRPLAPVATLAEYRKNQDITAELRGPQVTLLPVHPRTGAQWAMTIDTAICTGCSACMVACQAENNVPVVGKRGVLKSREMHWLRIDTYRTGTGKNARFVHQPMLCQHCENAPCEYVCPVNATVHSPDGLNEMVYNRCIGTRFCSNNCPYKVRRFNWFDFGEGKGIAVLQHNPQVTVRERGVMEKCTFCVQRIRGTEHSARLEDRPVREGEVVTACQQACATGAIQFGSLGEGSTPMVTWRKEPRRYEVLHDLGTRPRVVYLAAIRNTNPELEA